MAYALAALNEASPRRSAQAIDAGRTAEWACSLYSKRRYPAIFIGSSNGAMTHLCAALGVPWLPQTYLALVRQLFTDPNDPAEGLRRGKSIAKTIVTSNPRVDVHQMHDPSQDHLMLKSVGYFRLKHRSLPAAYRRFIADCLAPGGTIYLVECTATWPVVNWVSESASRPKGSAAPPRMSISTEGCGWPSSCPGSATAEINGHRHDRTEGQPRPSGALRPPC
jgi:hypothetical protein